MSKTGELHRYQLQLSKEQEDEKKKRVAAQKKLEKEQLEYQKKITRELESQKEQYLFIKNLSKFSALEMMLLKLKL